MDGTRQCRFDGTNLSQDSTKSGKTPLPGGEFSLSDWTVCPNGSVPQLKRQTARGLPRLLSAGFPLRGHPDEGDEGWWVGRDNAVLTEPALSHESRPKKRARKAPTTIPALHHTCLGSSLPGRTLCLAACLFTNTSYCSSKALRDQRSFCINPASRANSGIIHLGLPK